MILDDVHRGIHKRKKPRRLGRGPGSGRGKTSGRGHKGYGSRSGSKKRMGFEGGQMPLARRIAKRGFNNKRFAPKWVVVNVSSLQTAFEDGATVNPQTLAEKGLAKGHFDGIKILGDGALEKKLIVRAHKFSKAAEEKITAAGGSVETMLLGSLRRG